MNITAKPGPIEGMFLLESAAVADNRGAFMRSFCSETFAQLGLPVDYPQHNLSVNPHKATLRGLHYQLKQTEEHKLVRCVAGKIWDVVADLRPKSKTFGKWHGVELNGDGSKAVFIPAGCAHGCITLVENSSVYYLMSSAYRAENQRGIRFNDPSLNIKWPMAPSLISERDRDLPFLKDVFP